MYTNSRIDAFPKKILLKTRPEKPTKTYKFNELVNKLKECCIRSICG